MKEITYIKGDATCPIGDGDKIICHICNDVGAWGAGFTKAISSKWKEPEEIYRQTVIHHLGDTNCIQVESDVWVYNMIAQHGLIGWSNPSPIRYDALKDCLYSLVEDLEFVKTINETSPIYSVHMPRIGCGLAGGSWDVIEPIIRETLLVNDIDVFVYDL